jgi:hypothetical protein
MDYAALAVPVAGLIAFLAAKLAPQEWLDRFDPPKASPPPEAEQAKDVHSHWAAAVLAALLIAACAGGGPPSPNSMLLVAYDSLGVLDEQIGQAAFAGRLRAAKASAMLDESKRIRGQLDAARGLLTSCAGRLPCEPFDSSLRGINEQLVVMQCRRRQAEAGLPEDACRLPAAATTTTGSNP